MLSDVNILFGFLFKVNLFFANNDSSSYASHILNSLLVINEEMINLIMSQSKFVRTLKVYKNQGHSKAVAREAVD